jgi:methyl-accepting chemotaxis protein
MGLRLKFNLVIVPLAAAMTALMVWADYRHEAAAIMASHAIHSSAAGAASATGPVDPATLPEVVARNSLRAHILYGVALLALLVAAVNAALHVLVLRPLQRLGFRLIRMEHGHWRASIEPTSRDELGRFVHSFQILGVEIDALVSQSLQAERLAARALLSQRLRGRLEPDLHRVAHVAARLNGGQNADTQAAAQELARSAAAMFATVRGLDRVFPDDAALAARR